MGDPVKQVTAGPRIRSRPLLTDPELLPSALHPILKRVYAARGVSGEDQLTLALNQLASPKRLSNVDTAAKLLADAVTQDRRILIVGDFDADGATSTALGLLVLRQMGAVQVDFLVPNRFEYGYGLTPEIVEVALSHGPDLIVTVDNGISSLAGVAAARAAGVDVLVTDHHLPGNELPDANVLVNPNLPGDEFPSKNLAGVGVLFYILAALRAELQARGWFDEQGREPPRLADYLDLVALGTVADVVPLDHNNRVLVANGLDRIRRGRCRAGIRALLEISGRSLAGITASDLGFAVGPRLNAAGRLDDMSLGIHCLIETDPARANELAGQLDELNRERREIESGMRDEALVMVDQMLTSITNSQGEDCELPFGLCLFDERWHQGVIGIVAARVRESFHRPAIVFAPDNGDGLKGSARSIPGVHIRDTLDAVAAHNPGLLEKFGGHAMAAGLSLKREHFDRFCEAFEKELRDKLDPNELDAVVQTDGALQPQDIGMELAQALRRGGPWGQAFPEPLFEGLFDILDHRIVGERHLKMRVTPGRKFPAVDAIAFNQSDWAKSSMQGRLRLLYRLDINEYRGDQKAQLIVTHLDAP